MLFPVIGMALVAMVGLGGFLIASDSTAALGLLIGATGAATLGFLCAWLQTGAPSAGVHYEDGLTVRDVMYGTWRQTLDVPDDLTIYLANPDIMPATSVFTAQYDGKRVLIIEGENHAPPSK